MTPSKHYPAEEKATNSVRRYTYNTFPARTKYDRGHDMNMKQRTRGTYSGVWLEVNKRRKHVVQIYV